MKIRYGRLAGIAAFTAAAVLTSGPLWARQDVDIVEANAEDSLLGLHLMNSTFRDVLKKYGKPNEIQAGGPYSPTPPPGKADSSSGGGGMMGPGAGGGGMKGMRPPGMGGGGSGGGMGKPGMGGPGMGGPGMGGGGSSKQTSKNGFPGDNGGGGGGGMGGPGMAGPGMGGGMRPPGAGGSGGAPGLSGPGGLPGFSPPGAGAPGGEGEGDEGGSDELGSGTSTESNPPVKETTWWYHDPQTGLHMAFVFNRVGQIIQIGEYGPKKLQKMHGVLVPNAGATKRGLVLGNSMGSVVGKYGWSLDGAHSADNVIMRFGHKDKVAFQMVHNNILGITIGVARSGPSLAEGGAPGL